MADLQSFTLQARFGRIPARDHCLKLLGKKRKLYKKALRLSPNGLIGGY